MLTYYDISWPFSALDNKRRCFILEHNIRLNVRHSFGEPVQIFGFGRMSKYGPSLRHTQNGIMPQNTWCVVIPSKVSLKEVWSVSVSCFVKSHGTQPHCPLLLGSFKPEYRWLPVKYLWNSCEVFRHLCKCVSCVLTVFDVFVKSVALLLVIYLYEVWFCMINVIVVFFNHSLPLHILPFPPIPCLPTIPNPSLPLITARGSGE